MAQVQVTAGTPLPPEELRALVDQFHREGFLFFPEFLPADWGAELRDDLDRVLPPSEGEAERPAIELHHCMFEHSPANIRLFDLEPIVSLAEALCGDTCHVFHNNSFRVPPGGGITGWHQDDPSHFVVTDGPVPDNIHLPVLFFSCNYCLTDVETIAHGPTQVVRGSHLLGLRALPDPFESPYADRVCDCLGGPGSVVLFNNQVWHRGAPNTSDHTRYTTQVSYGRRIIGHRYYPFMNYQMPEHVYAGASPRLKRLLGFLPRGAYG